MHGKTKSFDLNSGLCILHQEFNPGAKELNWCLIFTWHHILVCFISMENKWALWCRNTNGSTPSKISELGLCMMSDMLVSSVSLVIAFYEVACEYSEITISVSATDSEVIYTEM
jgi:hypothetical protein